MQRACIFSRDGEPVDIKLVNPPKEAWLMLCGAEVIEVEIHSVGTLVLLKDAMAALIDLGACDDPECPDHPPCTGILQRLRKALIQEGGI